MNEQVTKYFGVLLLAKTIARFSEGRLVVSSFMAGGAEHAPPAGRGEAPRP